MKLRHNGWINSPFSTKTRAYLRFKGIDFEETDPSFLALGGRIRRSVGRMIVPTVEMPDGTWLQDTSDIIDSLEVRYPEPSVVPLGPTQRLASALLEVFGDEWLPMASLHYRWNLPQNSAFSLGEFARIGLPWLPLAIGRRLIAPAADKMKGYRSVLGILPQTISGIEETTNRVIYALNEHLSEQPYLLGSRPCIGDFSLLGPLWAHLYRDPGSTYLFEDAPRVVDWMERLLSTSQEPGTFLDGDAVPTSLDPIFELVFQDQWPWIKTLVAAIDEYCDQNPTAHRVPRALGSAPFQICGTTGDRKLVTFVQWKAQRARRAFEEAGGNADGWLERVGGTDQIIPIRNPFKRVEFKAVLDRG